MTTTADLVRVRAPGRSVEDGTLALDDAVQFVEQSRDMMLSAACAAIEKRPLYAKRKPQQAMNYLQHVRMGQTEHGSYVLTILSPVPMGLRDAQGHLDLTDADGNSIPLWEPYERQVVRTLVTGLHALGEAAQAAALQGDMEPFNDAVTRGVSANLCDAVLGLAEANPGEPLEVQVSWSLSRPLKEPGPVSVAIGSDSMPIIEEAARHFRARR